MKFGFVEAIIDLIKESPQIMRDLMIRESFYRKDLRLSGIDPDKIYNGFRNLQSRGYIKRKGSDFQLTEGGKNWYRGALFRYCKLKNRKWDKKWRIIIFDIPQEFHNRRVRLRTKLKILGFRMLQKSVFVFPYPCEEELGVICENLQVSDYVDVITADSVGFHEKEIRKLFKI